jgi:type I restriction enzyme S subunit
MSGNWKYHDLGDYCSVVNGSTPRTGIDEYWNGNIVWITPTDLGKNKNKYICDSERKITEAGYNSANTTIIKKNNIILSTRAPIGYIAINNVEACTNQGCKSILPNNELNAAFLYYYLKFNKDKLNDLGSGTTFNELSTSSLMSFQIPIPSIDEQERIVNLIETKLTAVEKAIELIKEQKSSIDLLFETYFRKLLRNDNTSKDWEIIKLGDICIEDKTIIDGSKSDLPFIGLEMVKSRTGEIIWEAQTMPGNSTCYYFDERHILYGKLRPYLNKVALPDFKGRCSTELVPLFVKPNYNKEFVSYLLRQNETVNYVMKEKTGSRMPRANMQYLLNMKVMVPSLTEQNRIVNMLKAKLEYISYLTRIVNEQYSYLESFPNSILRKAFNGEY